MRARHSAFLASFLILLTACMEFVSDYDSFTYQNLTGLKAETNVLLERCTETDGASVSELPDYEALYLHMLKAKEYETGKAHNSDTANQLRILTENVNQLVTRLRDQQNLSAGYCEAKDKIMDEAFDTAIATESNKLRHMSGD